MGLSFSAAFAAWVRGYFAARGIDHQDAGAKIGLTKQQISNRLVTEGTATRFSLDDAGRFIEAFGIDVPRMLSEIASLKMESEVDRSTTLQVGNDPSQAYSPRGASS